MNTFTNGRRAKNGESESVKIVRDNELKRIYDRLRKRARRHEKKMQKPGTSYQEMADADKAIYGGLEVNQAYVRGVKDALSAIAELTAVRT